MRKFFVSTLFVCLFGIFMCGCSGIFPGSSSSSPEEEYADMEVLESSSEEENTDVIVKSDGTEENVVPTPTISPEEKRRDERVLSYGTHAGEYFIQGDAVSEETYAEFTPPVSAEDAVQMFTLQNGQISAEIPVMNQEIAYWQNTQDGFFRQQAQYLGISAHIGTGDRDGAEIVNEAADGIVRAFQTDYYASVEKQEVQNSGNVWLQEVIATPKEEGLEHLKYIIIIQKTEGGWVEESIMLPGGKFGAAEEYRTGIVSAIRGHFGI